MENDTSDLACLLNISEDIINKNIEARFKADKIYVSLCKLCLLFLAYYQSRVCM